MPRVFAWLLPSALAVGWLGQRTARYIHRNKGNRRDERLMVILAWSPLAIWFIALLLFYFGWSR
jgi:hypothetical protein